MDYIRFKNQYFGGDDAAALQHLAKENLSDLFLLTENEERHKAVLTSMDADTSALYEGYYSSEVKKFPRLLELQVAFMKTSLPYVKTLNLELEELYTIQGNPFLKRSRNYALCFFALFGMYIGFVLLYQFTDIRSTVFDKIIDELYLPALCGIGSLIPLFKSFGFLRKARRFYKYKKCRDEVLGLNRMVWEGVTVPKK